MTWRGSSMPVFVVLLFVLRLGLVMLDEGKWRERGGVLSMGLPWCSLWFCRTVHLSMDG